MKDSGACEVTFVERRHGDRRWADHLAVSGPRCAESILGDFAGWAVSAPPEIEAELLAGGAAVIRRALEMRRSLVDSPPPSEWRSLPPLDELAYSSCDRRPEDVFPAWREAFGQSHPDHAGGSDAEALRARLTPLLAETVSGPFAAQSELLTDTSGGVAAGVFVIERGGSPWIGELFRRPGEQFRGTGSLLLRRALGQLALAGHTEVGLAVSEGNPAVSLYHRVGFTTRRRVVVLALPARTSVSAFW